MELEVRGELMRSRVRAACEISAELRDESRELIRLASSLRAAGGLRRDSRWQAVSRRLERRTKIVDDGVLTWRAMRKFLDFDSGLVGRDLVIEDAKTLLVERYDISRGEAFMLLRGASSRRNEKLRDVARRLIDESQGDDIQPAAPGKAEPEVA